MGNTRDDAEEIRLNNVIRAFAIGDALAELFEFRSPTLDEIEKSWYGEKQIGFTDDTMLLLSSAWSLKRSSLAGLGDLSPTFWQEMYRRTSEYLLAWFSTGVLRGIGNTTLAAMYQLERHGEQARDFASFKISPNGYDRSMSAGNGILSRALPLLVSGFAPDGALSEWLCLTHLHEDGHVAVADLANVLKNRSSPKSALAADGLGFYAPDTLQIAFDAVSNAKTSFEAFRLSQVPDGDNDSTAALTLGIWVAHHGFDKEIERIGKRLYSEDARIFAQSLQGQPLDLIFAPEEMMDNVVSREGIPF